MFEFDGEDEAHRYELYKECMGTVITLSAVTALDLKFLNRNKLSRHMGALKKFALINTH